MNKIPLSLRARAALAAFALALSGLAGVLAHPLVASAATGPGYLMVDEAGHVYPFGSAPSCGHSSMVFSNRATDVEITPNNKGYWILIDGGSVDFKDCGMSTADLSVYVKNNTVPLAAGEKAVSLSALPDGTGYWVFTNRGKAVPFGNATFYGDMSTTALNGAILGSVATSTGKGYWMVGSDGGIFSFGDAKFFGSTGNLKLNKPVMSMAPDPDGAGYWLVASDGGIFAFDALFKGSMGATPLNKPVSGMVPGANGYMMVAEDGGIFSFGDVTFLGSLGATPPSSPIRAVSLWTDVITPGPGSILGKVVFTSNRTAYGHNNPYNIWVMDPDGSNPRQLSDSSTGVSSPDLSPDGTRIVYTEDDAGTYMVMMNADGTNPTRITKYPASYYEPKWSPDGTRILYKLGYREIWTMKPDGSDDRKVFTSATDITHVSWSPDGTRLAVSTYTSYPTVKNELWSVTLADGKATKITDDVPDPAWSPDGKRFAFSKAVGVCGTPCSHIFTIAADGTDLRQVTTGDPKYQVGPVWTPDGTRLLFTLYAYPGADIYSMRLDGTDLRNLTNSGTATNASPTF